MVHYIKTHGKLCFLLSLIAMAIVYLAGGSFEQSCFAIQNVISDSSGMICDGAKSSCAMKIHSAVESSLLSAAIALNNNVIPYGIGIVGQDIEETIENVGIVAEAMCPIDDAITKIMTK